MQALIRGGMPDASDIKIAVASGKGGTGKTFIATHLFQALNLAGIRATLVDCDAEAPNAALFFEGMHEGFTEVSHKVPVVHEKLCTFCGKCHAYCQYNAIFLLPREKIIRVMEDLCHGCGACSVACTDGAISEKGVLLGKVNRYALPQGNRLIEARMETGVFSPVAVIKTAIREAGNHHTVIMDAPPGTSCPFIHTVDRADFVLLVTEPTPFGLSDLRQSVETLKIMRKKYGVLVNKAGLGNREIYDYIHREDIPLLEEIPFDRDTAASYAAGRLLVNDHPAWQQRFLDLFDTMISLNGNSHH